MTEKDPCGYLIIEPRPGKGTVLVKHFNNADAQDGEIEGDDVVAIYKEVIRRYWVSDLGHAAYLGKELSLAMMSMEHGFEYVQGPC